MNNKIKKITLSGLLATLTFIMTRYFSIPTAITGNINIGDSIVLLSGLILGPLYGGLAAASGSAFADLVSPYAIYSPATFVIKGLVAVTVSILFKKFRKLNLRLNLLVSSAIAEVIMILGYFLFEAFVLDFGVVVASYQIINNLVQAVASIIIVSIIYSTLSKSSLVNYK